MPRRKRKWIPKYEYERSPHADSRPESLWWFRPGKEESRKVVRRYLKQVARGRTVNKKLKKHLYKWLEELTEPIYAARGGRRYWTLPSYALDNDLNRSTFLKRFREMEKIAKRLYPDRVPRERRRITKKLRRDVRLRYHQIVGIVRAGIRRGGVLTDIFTEIARYNKPFEYNFPDLHNVAIRALSLEFDLPLFRVGLICRKLRVPDPPLEMRREAVDDETWKEGRRRATSQ